MYDQYEQVDGFGRFRVRQRRPQLVKVGVPSVQSGTWQSRPYASYGFRPSVEYLKGLGMHDNRPYFDNPWSYGMPRSVSVEGDGMGAILAERLDFAGLGEAYELRGGNELDGIGLFSEAIGGAWAILSGKSTQWYSNLNRIQNQLTVLNTAVNTIGKEMWNFVYGEIHKAGRTSSPLPAPYFATFESVLAQTNDFLAAGSMSIRVTEQYAPTDLAIATADAKAQEIQAMVEYAKKVIPEIAPAVNAESQKTAVAMANTNLQSPAVVGADAFKEDLKKRAAVFGGIGLGVGLLALVAVGVGLAIYSRK